MSLWSITAGTFCHVSKRHKLERFIFYWAESVHSPVNSWGDFKVIYHFTRIWRYPQTWLTAEMNFFIIGIALAAGWLQLIRSVVRPKSDSTHACPGWLILAGSSGCGARTPGDVHALSSLPRFPNMLNSFSFNFCKGLSRWSNKDPKQLWCEECFHY